MNACGAPSWVKSRVYPPRHAVEQLVAQPDVGERAADHHLVVAAPGAVGVEVALLHPVLDQVLPGRGVGLDRAGGGDVVRGHRVAELGEHPGAGDVDHRRRVGLHAVEVRRLADVGRLRVPLEGLALGRGQRAPALVAREDVRVVLGEHLLGDRAVDRRLDVAGRRPDVAQVDLAAVGRGAQRLGLEVEVHRAGEPVGDHERRAGQVVHLDVRVDPALEVPVARQHGDHGEVALVDPGRDLLGQRPGVADAGGAAVADQVVAQLLQVRPEAGPLVVVGDDLGAGRHRRLHPRLDREPPVDGVLGQQRGAEHDRRVRRVGARGDRGDHDGAVVQLEGRAVGEGDGHRPARPAVRALGGREHRLVRGLVLGLAAGCGRVAGREGLLDRLVDGRVPGRGGVVRVVLVRRCRRSRRGRSGRHAWPRRARCGPAGAWARRSTGRPWTGRARGSRRRPARGPGRARGPAPWRRPRRAPAGRPGGR